MNPKVLFWRAYYKLKFGKNYSERIQRANNIVGIVNSSSQGKLGDFYNTNGEKIRGYHKRTARHTVAPQHPLITKYGN